MLISPSDGETRFSAQIDGLGLASPSQISRPIPITTELNIPQPTVYLDNQSQRQNDSIVKQHPTSPISTLVSRLEHLGHYAPPLSPLRERDLVALNGLFQRSDIHAIELEVMQILLKLRPEPHWEEDPFEFLKEFL